MVTNRATLFLPLYIESKQARPSNPFMEHSHLFRTRRLVILWYMCTLPDKAKTSFIFGPSLATLPPYLVLHRLPSCKRSLHSFHFTASFSLSPGAFLHDQSAFTPGCNFVVPTALSGNLENHVFRVYRGMYSHLHISWI